MCCSESKSKKEKIIAKIVDFFVETLEKTQKETITEEKEKETSSSVNLGVSEDVIYLAFHCKFAENNLNKLQCLNWNWKFFWILKQKQGRILFEVYFIVFFFCRRNFVNSLQVYTLHPSQKSFKFSQRNYTILNTTQNLLNSLNIVWIFQIPQKLSTLLGLP